MNPETRKVRRVQSDEDGRTAETRRSFAKNRDSPKENGEKLRMRGEEFKNGSI